MSEWFWTLLKWLYAEVLRMEFFKDCPCWYFELPWKNLGVKMMNPILTQLESSTICRSLLIRKGWFFSACVSKAWRVQLTSYPATNTWKPLKIGWVSLNANFQGGFGRLSVWDVGICWQFQILRAPRRFGWPFKTSWSETLNTSQ